MANCASCGAPPLRPPAARCHVCGADAGGEAAPWAGKSTRLAPEAAVGALAQAVTARGAHITTQSATTLTGTITVPRKPNIIAALVLFMLCIVPMVIYLIVQSRPDVYVWSIHVAPEGEGSIVTYSGHPGAGPAIFAAVSSLP